MNPLQARYHLTKSFTVEPKPPQTSFFFCGNAFKEVKVGDHVAYLTWHPDGTQLNVSRVTDICQHTHGTIVSFVFGQPQPLVRLFKRPIDIVRLLEEMLVSKRLLNPIKENK